MDRDERRRKDQIISEQMEVIRTMAEHNLRRMGTDFWGTPAPAAPTPSKSSAPENDAREMEKSQAVRPPKQEEERPQAPAFSVELRPAAAAPHRFAPTPVSLKVKITS